jgi:uncharacterized membrane protein (DUF2068 family)
MTANTKIQVDYKKLNCQLLALYSVYGSTLWKVQNTHGYLQCVASCVFVTIDFFNILSIISFRILTPKLAATLSKGGYYCRKIGMSL